MRSRSVAQESVFSLTTLLLLALIAAGPVWGPGLLNTRGGGDSPFNLLRVHQLAANLRTGVFPVRWMPDAAYGLGYPFFSYYAALPYYLAAGLTLIGVDILSAIKLTQTLFFAAAAAGMYGWARRALRSQAGGWLAAVAYTVAPYHLVNVYVRGDSLSEFAAFAFYPLILWGLDRLAERPSLRRMIPPALAYAGLIVTHNLSAFIFSLFVLLPYFVFHVLRCASHAKQPKVARITLKKLSSTVVLFTGSLLVGILLSAWYWFPALAETGAVQMTAQTSGYFSYDKHFRGANLVQPRVIFDYYAITPDQPTAFAAMGLVQTLVAIAGIIAVVLTYMRSQNTKRDLLFAIIGLLLTTWLVTPLSRPLWDAIPPLQLTQFPWRILSIQALFAAFLAGTLPQMLRKEGKWQWGIGIALALFLTVAGLAGLRPEYLPITAEEVTVERLQLYELFTGNIGTTIRYEWLPRWVVPRPFTGPALFEPDEPPRAIPLSRELVGAEEIVRKPTRRTWMVETGDSGAEISFPLYYWPGWQATVDSSPVETRPAPDSGYLSLTVPAGEHTVTMRLGRTPVRVVAELVSLVTALSLSALLLVKWRMARGKQLLYPAPCIIGFVLILALLVVFHPRVDADVADLTMDFDSQPYLHHNPAGVAMGGWRLTGYQYSADRLEPGDTLHVTLDLEAEREPASVTLRLVSPAAVRQQELSAVATATATISPPAYSAALDLSIPGDASPGMHLLQLKGQATSVYLRPIWISAGERAAEQPEGAAFADGALHLHAVEASQASSDRLDLRLDWSATEPIAANYGISLRLADPAGNEWARLDTQPGYGFLPTSLWPVDRLIHDRYTLSLPMGTPPGSDYTLTVILYRAASGESVGEHTFPVALERATIRPDAPIAARFGDELALSHLEVPKSIRQGETLHFTAYWLAVKQPAEDYITEWWLSQPGHLTPPTSLPPAPGSPPATWPAGAWVAGRAELPISPFLPPDDYTFSLMVIDPTNYTSLGIYTHPQPVRVERSERIWELPEIQQEVGARFGDRPGGIIELAGYNLAQEENALKLTLYWRALATPDQHYMFFIHVADPATGIPATQIDTMPRAFTYPTGMWAPGEVISDEVAISLEEVPAGTYALVIGWYHPDDPSQRLPATDAAGNPLPDNRLVLPDSVIVP